MNIQIKAAEVKEALETACIEYTCDCGMSEYAPRFELGDVSIVAADNHGGWYIDGPNLCGHRYFNVFDINDLLSTIQKARELIEQHSETGEAHCYY